MMPTADVMQMIMETLQTMVGGLFGVFSVLAVFYCTIKLMGQLWRDGQ